MIINQNAARRDCDHQSICITPHAVLFSQTATKSAIISTTTNHHHVRGSNKARVSSSFFFLEAFYHFRLLCCSSSFSCILIVIHLYPKKLFCDLSWIRTKNVASSSSTRRTKGWRDSNMMMSSSTSRQSSCGSERPTRDDWHKVHWAPGSDVADGEKCGGLRWQWFYFIVFPAMLLNYDLWHNAHI